MEISPLKTGEIVKIWHGNRGYDYVILGVQGTGADRKLGLLKNTCLNDNGYVRLNTRKMHSWVPVKQMEEYGVANRIKRICGTRVMNKHGITAFVRHRLKNVRMRALKESDEIYANASANDARIATSY